MCSTRPYLAALISAALLLPTAGRAADLFRSDAATLLRTDRATAEVFGGYLSGQGREYVSNIPFRNDRLSQLNWRIDNAFVVGGRLAFSPFDGVTLRLRGWVNVQDNSTIDDYDWLAGYAGFNSWTDWSHHPNTNLAKAWQGDVSGAYRWWQDDDLALTAIGGYRYLTMKWNAKGGSFVYSTFNFYDTVGAFPADQLVGAYQQWWSAPYLGLGFAYKMGAVTLTGELIGSAWATAESKDHHVLRVLVIKDDFRPTTFFAATLGAEYAYSDWLSFTARAEYENFGNASGAAKYLDGMTGSIFNYRKPGATADAENVLLSLGVKTRL